MKPKLKFLSDHKSHLWFTCFCICLGILYCVSFNANAATGTIKDKPDTSSSKNNPAATISKRDSGLATQAAANCYDINWASWNGTPGNTVSSATGTINTLDGNINVTMASLDYTFGFTSGIYTLSRLSGYPSAIPDRTVPKTTWSANTTNIAGKTTMTFSQTVTNPVLLLASLGSSNGTQAKLTFSLPYVVVYDGGNMVYNDNYSITGTEGYAVIMFPGEFTSVTVNSTTYENYTNITWGVKPQPFPIAITENSNSCGAVQLTASGGVSYKWNDGDTPNSATNTFHNSGTYVVTVTSADGCTASTSKTVTVQSTLAASIKANYADCGYATYTASGGTTYLWDGGDTPNSASNTFHTSGTYHVTVSNDNGCSTVASVAVTVQLPSNATVTKMANSCNSVTYTASGASTYSWDGGDSPHSATNTFHVNGRYVVTATNAAGCITGVEILVSDLTPEATITGNNIGCNDVTLTASGGTTYLWDGGATPHSATNTFNTSGNYTVTVTNAAGCMSTATATVTVNNQVTPQISILSSATGSICSGTPVTFTATVTNGGGNPDLQWYKNNVYVTTASSYMSSGLNDRDVITCKLNNTLPCAVSSVISNAITVDVKPSPEVYFSGDLLITDSEPVQLNPNIKGDIVQYIWTPAIGLNSTSIPNPLANPANATTYHLQVFTAEGCEADADVSVNIKKALIIPNIFTPNGDGINDTWNITYINYLPNVVVNIYNRWGTPVFHSIGYPKAWDGNFNGTAVPAGVYYYLIDYKDGITKPLSGYLTVIR